MEAVFYPYTIWEDFKNGMYDEDRIGRAQRVNTAIEIFEDEQRCYNLMKLVTETWQFATAQTLTSPYLNHRPFLGQCACNILDGVKEDETRQAWGMISEFTRIRANKIADKVRDEWIKKYERQSGCYQMSLFDDEV